jgi:hypothetical protein
VFFAVRLGDESGRERFDRALRHHGERLRETGWVGRLATRDFVGGVIAWDAESTHVHIAEGTDAFVLYGGYHAGADAWDDAGRHEIESPGAWGEFAAVVVRPGRNVTVFADPAGSWPVYHASLDRSAVVVSNDALFAGVATACIRLDADAVFEMATYSHVLGAETSIEGVSRLLVGERLSVLQGASGAERRIERRPAYAYRASKASPAELERRAVDALVAGAEALVPLRDSREHATVELSGGLDSRLTAGAIAAAFTPPPQMMTLDLSDGAELEIARDVAVAIGAEHRVQRLRDADADALRRGWLLTGGQVATHAAAGNILVYEGARRAPEGAVLIVGAWPGDCLIGSYVPNRPFMTAPLLGRLSAASWGRRRGVDWERGQVAGPRAAEAVRRSRRRLVADLVRDHGLTAAQRISFWAMFVRQPAFSYCSPARLTSHVLEVTPVLARPYVEVLLSLDGRQIFGKNFYRSLIADEFPELATIPYAATGRPVTRDPIRPRLLPRSLGEAYELLPRWARRQVRTLFGAWRRPAAESLSAEAAHWVTVFDGLGAPQACELPGLTIRASGPEDLHVRGIALAARWTQEYLEEAARAIDSGRRVRGSG